jgi:hypothetical protein
MIGVYAILGVDAHGWGSPRTLGLGGAALGLLAAFIVRQARIADPLLPLRLFRSRALSAANAVQVLLAPGLFGTFFLGALYLRRELGYDPLQVGLAYLPMALVMAGMSFRFTARLTTRFGIRATVLCAMLAIAGALALFARTPVDATYPADLLPPMLLFGLGAGLGFPSLAMLAMSGAAPEDSGLASGLVNTSMQLGGAVGLAVLATLATERTSSLQTGGASAASALNGGYHLAYLVGVALVGLAATVALTTFREPRRQGAPAVVPPNAGSSALTAAQKSATSAAASSSP